MLRHLLAFVSAALVTASAYTTAILVEYTQRVGVSISSPDGLFALVTVFALLFVLVVGVPAYLLFARQRWNKLWMYCAAGSVMGGLAMNGLFGPSIPFIGVLIGAVGAAVFWSILRPDRPNLQFDAGASRRST